MLLSLAFGKLVVVLGLLNAVIALPASSNASAPAAVSSISSGESRTGIFPAQIILLTVCSPTLLHLSGYPPACAQYVRVDDNLSCDNFAAANGISTYVTFFSGLNHS